MREVYIMNHMDDFRIYRSKNITLLGDIIAIVGLKKLNTDRFLVEAYALTPHKVATINILPITIPLNVIELDQAAENQYENLNEKRKCASIKIYLFKKGKKGAEDRIKYYIDNNFNRNELSGLKEQHKLIKGERSDFLKLLLEDNNKCKDAIHKILKDTKCDSLKEYIRPYT